MLHSVQAAPERHFIQFGSDTIKMNERTTLQRMLERDRVIAVVGLSNRPHRPSHSVSAYMQSHGYRIVPINPAYANNSAGVLGERCYATLTDAANALAAEDLSIGMVNELVCKFDPAAAVNWKTACVRSRVLA